MFAKLFQVDCITNLHVGSGDVNYNIIDNEIEKDPVTGYATINASGVKGAFREYYSKNPELVANRVIELFGGEENGKSVPGAIKFLQADILAMPVRATLGEEPFYLITSESCINNLYEKIKMFENLDIKFKYKKETSYIKAEGISLKDSCYIELDNEKRVYIVKDEEYRKLMYPVVARNKLDNGKSENLWYEEIVPHHSIFTFYALSDDEKLINSFKDDVSKKIVQFGGGATVGYGYCKITDFKEKNYE